MITHKRLEISILNLVQSRGSQAPSIVTTFMQIDAQSKFYGILNVLKNVCGSSNFRNIKAIILKLHTNIIYQSRTFGIEFNYNRLRRRHFFRFRIF